MKRSPVEILKRSEGLALFTVLFTVTVFLLFITATLLLSRLELKKTSNMKLATQILEVADAGLQHGLALIPWVWDFDGQLNCGTPPCTLVSNYSFPSGSGFSYTIKVRNDPPEASPTDDTNNTVVLVSEATGPSNTKKVVEAYVRRSTAAFTVPAPLYINANSVTPAFPSEPSYHHFFEYQTGIRIIGNDTNPNNLSNEADDSAGPQASLWGIATTRNGVATTLRNEWNTHNSSIHDILGGGTEPSIGTASANLDIDKIALNILNAALPENIYLNGLETDDALCPSSSPCQLGTSAAPQITYIKESYGTDITDLRGHVEGYGVLVFEGRPAIGGDFRFYGLIVHKRSDGSHYVSFENNAKVYGGVLLGSFDEQDGYGKKTRFTLRNSSRLFYSSVALAMVESNWGSMSIFPKPPRVFAWVDK